MTPEANDLCVFAVKRGELNKKEIYCNPLVPFYLHFMEMLKSSPYCKGSLSDYVDINPKTDCKGLSNSSVVSFVPMPNVREKTNIVTYDLVPYELVKKGFTVFQKHDLIWAKITPCMQNGKSCIVDDMPTEIGFGSTEFHVIRNRDKRVYMPFLWAVLSNDNVLKAAQAVFNGSAGQQRVSSSFLERFPAVIPEKNIQEKLVLQLEEKLCALHKKKNKANELLLALPDIIMNILGLAFDYKSASLIYAIRKSDILERVDASFYSPKFVSFRRQIENGKYPAVSIGSIASSITTGFAAGKKNQADELPDEERVTQLRPFSITPEGELSFETQKYVPKNRVRESLANTLIHQDFSVTGTGPVVEIFENRIEFTNAGEPLVDVIRIIDNPPKSRNEKLASLMRNLHICEELGTGWDKIVISCELFQLPAPRIEILNDNTRVTLFANIPYTNLTPEDKLWACYLHACIKHVQGECISNQTLRERFGLPQTSSASVSRLIKDALAIGMIKPVDPDTAPRYMKYIPGWA